jgi:hypothetical protein
MNAICLVTITPTNEWCDYLNRFTNYKIYIVVDDNNFDYTLYKTMFSNLFFIKFQHESYKVNGYTNTQFDNTAWDKALYYFAVENTNHKHVWFIDSKLNKCDQQTLIYYDQIYEEKKVDLLYSRFNENRNGYKGYWLWNKIDLKYSNPYYNGELIATRLSQNMLSKINEYASQFKSLFYIEALLPTVSIKNKLMYLTPE